MSLSYRFYDAAAEVTISVSNILNGKKVITLTDNGDGRKTLAVVDKQ